MDRSERERFYHDSLDVWTENRKIHTRFRHVFKSPNSRRGEHFFDDLLRAAVPNQRVLEIGCGNGFFCQKVLEMGAAEVEGIDLSARMLAPAQPRTGTSLHVYEHDAHLPWQGRYYVIFGRAILHHLDYREVLPRLYQDNLLPGGEMVFFEPLGGNLLMRVYWKLGTRYHTPDERPFRQDDLHWLARTFPSFSMAPFNYTTIVAGIVSSLLSGNPTNRLMAACDRIDSLLAKKCAFLKSRFRTAVFHIRKPAVEREVPRSRTAPLPAEVLQELHAGHQAAVRR